MLFDRRADASHRRVSVCAAIVRWCGATAPAIRLSSPSPRAQTRSRVLRRGARGAPSVVLERDLPAAARDPLEALAKGAARRSRLALDDKKLVVQRGARELETRPTPCGPTAAFA